MKSPVLALSCWACAIFGSPALGADYVWNNTGTDWSVAGSGSPSGGSPGAGDTAQFNVLGTFGTGTINQPVLNTSTQVTQLSISNTATFQGWSLTGTGSLVSGTSSVSGLVTWGMGTTTVNLGNGTATSLQLSGATGAMTNGAINIGNGSSLLLTGNTVGLLSGSSAIMLRGGTLVLDNSQGNPAGGQRLTGTGQVNLAGGGSVLEFRGAIAGPTSVVCPARSASVVVMQRSERIRMAMRL